MTTTVTTFAQKHKSEQLLGAVCSGDENLYLNLITFDLASLTRHPSTLATLLHLAAIHERSSILSHLVQLTPSLIDEKDIDGRTALHYAAILAGTPNSNDESYHILLENGAREQITDGEGYTAENYRCSPKLLDMEFIKEINMFPCKASDEIDQLISDGKLDALEEIILSGSSWQLEDHLFPLAYRNIELSLNNLLIKCLAIQQAIVTDDLGLVKQLVDMEKFALSRDSSGRTPLHNAAALGRKSICEYLSLIYPNCVNSIDRFGKTPLHYAYGLEKADEREAIVSILMKAGANEDIADKAGYLPKQCIGKHNRAHPLIQFNYTMATDEAETAEQQLERRIMNLDFDSKKFTELEDIQISGKLEEIRRIVGKHLDNERLVRYMKRFRKQQNRLNAAIMAIEDNQLKKLKRLIDSDMVEARNTENGRAAIHYAATQKNAIYDTLVDCGANELLTDKTGLTAAQYRENPETTLSSPLLLIPTSTDLNFNRFSLDENMYDPENEVNAWLLDGDVKQLEQILLDGRGYLLADKTSNCEAVNEFLNGISRYQSKIDAIHKAVEEGDIRRVKSLIDREQLATARDRYGMTPLHTAVLHGQTNTVRYLLRKYPSCVNATDHTGRTALHYASADPAGEHMIKLMQKAGADAFIEDKLGHTPFYYRTHGRRLNVKMLKDNALMNELISGQMNRPLLQDLEEDIADWIHTGNVGKLEELVLNGYADLLLGRTNEVDDPDTVNFLDVLPQYKAKIDATHNAIETGNLRAIKMLVDRKKMAFCRDVRHLAPLHKAIVFGQTDIAKYLIRNYPQSANAMDQNKRTPLHYAATLRDGGYLYKMMRRAGADPNVHDCNGRPPKHYLKYPGEIDLQAMKMDRKAILDEVIHSRVAPSYLESNIRQWIRDGNVTKLEQLVLSGCGDLLLNHTAAASSPESSTFLQHLGTYMDQIQEIHATIKEGNLERLKELLTTKKLALARNRHGCTPLHTAIVYEQTEIIRFIVVQFPIVLNAPDYNKRTAMHYAAATRDGGHYMKILSKAGADPMAMDNEGRTPDYYRRNTVINLKLMKEDDLDMDFVPEELIDEAPRLDSPQSGDSASASSSVIESSPLEEPDDAGNFERYLSDRTHLPTSESGLYLARTVAPALTNALAEVLLQRPPDPVTFIAEWLLKHREETSSQ